MKIFICVTLKHLPDWYANWIKFIIRGLSGIHLLFTQHEGILKKKLFPQTHSKIHSCRSFVRFDQSIRKLTLNRAVLKNLRRTLSWSRSHFWITIYIPKRDSALISRVSRKKTWLQSQWTPNLSKILAVWPENSLQFWLTYPTFLPMVFLVGTVDFQLSQVFWKRNHRNSTAAE